MAKQRQLAIGLDLGGTAIKAALIDDRGRILGRAAAATPTGAHRIATALADLTKTVAANNHRALPLAGIGLGTPGGLDRRGRIAPGSFNLPGWAGFPVCRTLRDIFGIPVIGANDADAAVLGEWRWGKGKKVENLVLLTLGTGLGSGIISGGKLLAGAKGGGPEIGHLPIALRVPDERRCSCGLPDCVEAYLGAAGLRQTFQANGGSGDWTPAQIFAAARRGHRAARASLRQYADLLGALCGSLITIFNPAVVLLGGGMAKSSRQLLPRVRSAARRVAWPAFWRDVAIRAASPDAGVKGAASLILL